MNKEAYRKLYKSKRKELSREEIDEMSESIATLLLHNFDFVGKKVHTFVSISGKKEINTKFLVNQLFTIDCEVSTSITHLSPDYLEHTRIFSHTKYGFDSFGIPTPLEIHKVKEEDFDVVIVPLLCIDQVGHRIGYGKGFYDRFLRNCRPDCVFIGLSLFDKVTESFEVDQWDVKLNYCVTPKEIIQF
jgi:5-formyltetrahydrofolate cyclo-ligase